MKSPQKILKDLDHHPSKRRGQNFLIQPNSVRQIVAWAGPNAGQAILEIGPGLGAMTNELLRLGSDVYAVEIDPKLCQHLNEKFGSVQNFHLIHQDFLQLDWDGRLAEGTYFVLANLPYSVTTPILESLIAHRTRVSAASLLVQEEVAARISSEPGKKNYGRLSVFLQNYFACTKGPRISRNSFYPKPDVESRLLRLDPRPSPLVPPSLEEEFFSFSRFFFSHPRKTVRKILLHHKGAEVLEAAERSGIDLSRRPGTFAIAEILSLLKTIRSAHSFLDDS